MGRLALVSLVASLALAQAAAAGGPLTTAITGEPAYSGSEANLAFARTHAAGANVVRLVLSWREVAPPGAQKPQPFNASNPADPSYSWAAFDKEVRLAKAHGLDVIAAVSVAPQWALDKGAPSDSVAYRPNPLELARFATAAARRYSGSFQGLPRIHYWQVWNEPNASFYLAPQIVNGQIVSVAWYRRMVNAFADAVHAVRRDNSAVIGGLSPFTIEQSAVTAVGPIRFMRALLCLSAGSHPRRTCRDRIHFDIWAHHPYTSGGPTHRAANPNDASIGDLPRMKSLLDAAVKHGTILSKQRMRFWVTEFSWDTNPPDGYYTVPIQLHARWVAEALYRMWQAGVSLVSWYLLRDQPYPSEPAQSGLYFRGASLSGDRAKPSLAAFRFPFVAFREPRAITIWGRTPTSRPANVIVERGQGKRWTRLGMIRADRYGIFNSRLKVGGSGDLVRARLASGKGVSLAFSLTRPRDRYVLPFGGGGAQKRPLPWRVAAH